MTSLLTVKAGGLFIVVRAAVYKQQALGVGVVVNLAGIVDMTGVVNMVRLQVGN